MNISLAIFILLTISQASSGDAFTYDYILLRGRTCADDKLIVGEVYNTRSEAEKRCTDLDSDGTGSDDVCGAVISTCTNRLGANEPKSFKLCKKGSNTQDSLVYDTSDIFCAWKKQCKWGIWSSWTTNSPCNDATNCGEHKIERTRILESTDVEKKKCQGQEKNTRYCYVKDVNGEGKPCGDGCRDKVTTCAKQLCNTWFLPSYPYVECPKTCGTCSFECKNNQPNNKKDEGCPEHLPRCTGGTSGDDGEAIENAVSGQKGVECKEERVLCKNDNNHNGKDTGCTNDKPRCIGYKSNDTGETIPNVQDENYGDKCIAEVETCTDDHQGDTQDTGCTVSHPRCTGGESGDDGTDKKGNSCKDAGLMICIGKCG